VGELSIGGISAAHNPATTLAQHGLVGSLQQLRHTGRAYKNAMYFYRSVADQALL
jgi:hypothetical protein